MTDGIWVGLDVHANKSVGAMLDSATGEVCSHRMVGRPHELIPWLSQLHTPMKAVYEAGPTGFGLARRARVADCRGVAHARPLRTQTFAYEV